MRISLAIVLAVGIAVAVVVALRGDDEPPAGATGALTLVGDSLNVGTEPHLRDALPGWQIDAYDQVGRTTSAGVEELRRIGDNLAPVVVVSLGTNVPDGSEAAFRTLVAKA